MPRVGDLLVPLLHLNGTSKDALMQQHVDAYKALQEAIWALAAPNARDYYIDGSMDAAREQYARHMAILRGLADELRRIYEAIDAQGGH